MGLIKSLLISSHYKEGIIPCSNTVCTTLYFIHLVHFQWSHSWMQTWGNYAKCTMYTSVHIYSVSTLLYQQNHRMTTPSAASDTLSFPPSTGYIQSRKRLHHYQQETQSICGYNDGASITSRTPYLKQGNAIIGKKSTLKHSFMPTYTHHGKTYHSSSIERILLFSRLK